MYLRMQILLVAGALKMAPALALPCPELAAPLSCSVAWCSKLQLNITQPTMEAEYTALLISCKAVIPLLEVTVAIAALNQVAKHMEVTFTTTVHEEVSGTLPASCW